LFVVLRLFAQDVFEDGAEPIEELYLLAVAVYQFDGDLHEDDLMHVLVSLLGIVHFRLVLLAVFGEAAFGEGLDENVFFV
jgi:hypothetical protein